MDRLNAHEKAPSHHCRQAGPADEVRGCYLHYSLLDLGVRRTVATTMVIGVRVDTWPCSGSRGQADQIGADLPEPPRGGRVVAALGRSFGFAVGEVAAGYLLEVGRGSQVDRRGGALARGLHEMQQERDEQSLDEGGVLGSEGGAYYAGMQRIGGEGRGSQPPGQLIGEQNGMELGLVVGACARG